jgi:predicted oxidoreductase
MDDIMVKRIIQGLMRIDRLSEDELYDLVLFDLVNGINVFDLADCYIDGEAEAKLGRVLENHKELRDRMYIQTKCSIVRGVNKYYDLSYEHIMESVYASLKRLNIIYLDSLLLHRPDILLDPVDIKKAFLELKEKGLVRLFAVSNFSKEGIEYLNSEVGGFIEVNQIQLSLGQMRLLEEELSFNMNTAEGVSHTNCTFFYLKRKGIEIEVWSPFLAGFFEGSIFDDPRLPNLNAKLW